MASPYQDHMPRESGSVAFTTAETTSAVTLAFTPDWVVIGESGTAGEDAGLKITISGTTTGLVTFTRSASTSTMTVYYLAG